MDAHDPGPRRALPLARSLLSIALTVALPAAAAELPADGRVPGSSAAAVRIEEGIWEWIDRLDGEIVPEQAIEELVQQAEADLVEATLDEGPWGLDVPLDYYDDPAGTLVGDPLLLELVDASEFDIPIEINAEVKKWMRFFLGPYRKHTARYLSRKARYEQLIYEEMDRVGLPRDLIYLSMVESGFNAYAYSHAHASGLWQFISSTGRMYGLEVGYWVDERRDPEKATRAAGQMLGDLHKMFGDWYLAFAAYNTGPGRVKRAVASLSGEIEKPTYWDLLERGLLHRETAGYVPKIIASAIIGKHPERYGFGDLELEPPLQWDTVEVDGAYDVVVLAKTAGLTEEEFRLLNPALTRFTKPEGALALHVPAGTGEAFRAALAEVPEAERRTMIVHKVRSGETLSTIASRYGISMALLQSSNGISNANRIYAGMRLTVPVPAGSSAAASVAPPPPPASPSASAPSPASSASASTVPGTHRIRRGETLSEIAGRYGLSTSELQAWNGISDPRRIYAGQTLALTAPDKASGTVQAPAPPAAAASAPAPSGRETSYTVRSGDTLWSIAQRFGVSTADLQAWNGLRGNEIYAGQRLKLVGVGGGTDGAAGAAGAASTTHVVGKGETLSGIASRYGVSTSDLQAWNGISDPRRIYAGQKLLVRGGAAGGQAPAAQWGTHVVASGESLGLIAERYGCSVNDLRTWNSLRSSTIYPGQRLKVPAR